jgi:AraC family transcriptional regulator
MHEAHLHDTNVRVFMMEISPRWIERLREDSLTLRSTFEFSGGPLPHLGFQLNREFHKTDGAARLAIEGLAIEVLAQAARQSSTKCISRPGVKSELRTTPLWLCRAREMIAEHFAETLTLAYIAAQVGVHPVHLATTFRQKYGVTVGEFIRKVRVDHACAELMKDNLPLAEIALRAGFVDQSHFSKVFKFYVGTTPAKYRRILRSS